MGFLQQTWTLAEKDLLIVLGRRYVSTLIRALIFPIVFTVVISNIRNWTASSGVNGVGTPSPLR